jgi:hypothetical protein
MTEKSHLNLIFKFDGPCLLLTWWTSSMPSHEKTWDRPDLCHSCPAYMQ